MFIRELREHRKPYIVERLKTTKRGKRASRASKALDTKVPMSIMETPEILPQSYKSVISGTP